MRKLGIGEFNAERIQVTGGSDSEISDTTTRTIRRRDGVVIKNKIKKYATNTRSSTAGAIRIAYRTLFDMHRATKSKIPTIRQRIQNNGGDGDQILPTVEQSIVSFQNETALSMRAGLEVIAEKDRGDDMERDLFTLRADLWFSLRRNYWDSLQKSPTAPEDKQT